MKWQWNVGKFYIFLTPFFWILFTSLKTADSVYTSDSKLYSPTTFLAKRNDMNCEAQARVRQGSARDGSQGERSQRLNPCLELTLKLVATHHHHPPPTTTQKSHYSSLMARQLSGEVGGGKGRCVGSLWVTLGSL